MEQADALLETASPVSSEREETVVPDSPEKELKPLPDSLKYKFLGPTNSLPIIIAFGLDRCLGGGIVGCFERA
jgi:hypothetical protein